MPLTLALRKGKQESWNFKVRGQGPPRPSENLSKYNKIKKAGPRIGSVGRVLVDSAS